MMVEQMRDRRMQEFSEGGLKISEDKLFCVSCKEEPPNLKESICRHITTGEHEQRRQKLAKCAAANQELHDNRATYFEGYSELRGRGVGAIYAPSVWHWLASSHLQP